VLDGLRRTVLLLVFGCVALVAGTVRAAPALAAEPLLKHAQAVALLGAAGITWSSSGGCSDRNRPTCTSFERIRRTTVSGVRTLKSASRCPVNVTAGTEVGHVSGPYSHGNGYKVDVSHHPCIDAYITTTFQRLAYAPGWGQPFRAPSGNLYVDEGSHWDIVYYSCGCRVR
jgi:hypothetical protein